jgi:hypothetical protein
VQCIEAQYCETLAKPMVRTLFFKHWFSTTQLVVCLLSCCYHALHHALLHLATSCHINNMDVYIDEPPKKRVKSKWGSDVKGFSPMPTYIPSDKLSQAEIDAILSMLLQSHHHHQHQSYDNAQT